MDRRDFLKAGLACSGAGLAVSLAPGAAFAQSFPSRPVRIIVPSTAGGIHDIIARVWAERVKGDLGSPVVENRGGGAALIAIQAVANAEPDGHSLLLGSTSTIVMRVLEERAKYAIAEAMEPATIFSASSTSIVVNSKLPVTNVKELIEYAKGRPGKLSFGSGGVGAITHVAGELFKLRGGLDMVHVPYRGVAPALNDFVAGRLDVMFPNITSQILQMHDAKELRILAIAAPERLDAAPHIPTAIEAGLPGFVAQLTFGVFAPARTPEPVLERVYAATRAGWADKAFRKQMFESGFEPVADAGPARSRALMAEEYERWRPVIESIKAQNANR